MAFDVRMVDLVKLNSLTKYPSIPTYHTLDPKNGNLLDEVVPFEGLVIGTEKVDGTNARVICLTDGSFILGSREEFLYARGDLIGNSALGIVEAMKATAERLRQEDLSAVVVYYFEVYGGKVTGSSKQYTGEGRIGSRLFDVATIPEYEVLLRRSTSQISQWREGGGQVFLDEAALHSIAERYSLELTPRVFEVEASELPKGIEATYSFLQQASPTTLCALDSLAGGKPEGLVVRTLSRSVIAKARFADYERTLKKRKLR
jgi:hypothetical protein